MHLVLVLVLVHFKIIHIQNICFIEYLFFSSAVDKVYYNIIRRIN